MATTTTGLTGMSGQSIEDAGNCRTFLTPLLLGRYLVILLLDPLPSESESPPPRLLGRNILEV